MIAVDALILLHVGIVLADVMRHERDRRRHGLGSSVLYVVCLIRVSAGGIGK